MPRKKKHGGHHHHRRCYCYSLRRWDAAPATDRQGRVAEVGASPHPMPPTTMLRQYAKSLFPEPLHVPPQHCTRGQGVAVKTIDEFRSYLFVLNAKNSHAEIIEKYLRPCSNGQKLKILCWPTFCGPRFENQQENTENRLITIHLAQQNTENRKVRS